MTLRFLVNGVDRWTTLVLVVPLVVAAAIPVLHVALPVDHPYDVPTYVVSLVGKYLTYALLALLVDGEEDCSTDAGQTGILVR